MSSEYNKKSTLANGFPFTGTLFIGTTEPTTKGQPGRKISLKRAKHILKIREAVHRTFPPEDANERGFRITLQQGAYSGLFIGQIGTLIECATVFRNEFANDGTNLVIATARGTGLPIVPFVGVSTGTHLPPTVDGVFAHIELAVGRTNPDFKTGLGFTKKVGNFRIEGHGMLLKKRKVVEENRRIVQSFYKNVK
jgi:hypothetical protein